MEHLNTTSSNFHTRFLCGFIQVPVSVLDFDTRCNRPREVDDQVKARLSELFSREFKPGVPGNHLAGVVTEIELESILRELQINKEELRQTIYSGSYPHVEGTRVWCPADRHRVEAAAELFGNEVTWVVQLHCPPSDTPTALYEEFIRALSERYFPQYNHSDGEIFRSIRRYQKTQPELVSSWVVRLTASKRISLNLLLDEANSRKKTKRNPPRHSGVLETLDKILVFPGLWEGLEFGNLHKHLALGCDDEIVRYLEHVEATWAQITGSDPEIQSCVDINTARALQSLAPAVSWVDRKAIGKLLADKKVFGGLHDPLKRSQVRERLLRVDRLIPTIKSFHENMKLFTITAKVLRTYLLPEKSRASLFAYLKDIWRRPQVAFVEFAEGSFQAISGPPSFELAYIQLFCAALRNFPELSDDVPKMDSGDKIRSSVTRSAISLFYRRVVLLGFRNSAIQSSIRRGLQRAQGRGRRIELEGQIDTEVESTSRRWGRPYTRIFRRMRHVAFLPRLHRSAPASAFPTVEHIVKDFICSFLGTLGPELEPIVGEIVSITAQSGHPLRPIPEEYIDERGNFEYNDGAESVSSLNIFRPISHAVPNINTEHPPTWGTPTAALESPSPEVTMVDRRGPPAAAPSMSESSREARVTQATQEERETLGAIDDVGSAAHFTQPYSSQGSVLDFMPSEAERSQLTSEFITYPMPSSALESGQDFFQPSEGLTPFDPSFPLPRPYMPSLLTMPSSTYSIQTPAPSLPTIPVQSSIYNAQPLVSSLHEMYQVSPFSSPAPSLALPGGDSSNSAGTLSPRSEIPSLLASTVAPRFHSLSSMNSRGDSLQQPSAALGYLSNRGFSPGTISPVNIDHRSIPESVIPSRQASHFSQSPELWNIGSSQPYNSTVPSYIQSSILTSPYELSHQGFDTPERSVASSLIRSTASSRDSMVDVRLSSQGEDLYSVGSRSIIQSPQRVSRVNGFLDSEYWDI